MKAVLRMECAAPRGRDYDGLDIKFELEIPFVPAVDMCIKPGLSGDYVRVLNVYWDAAEPDLLDIGVEEPNASVHDDLRPFSYWKKQGWKLDKV